MITLIKMEYCTRSTCKHASAHVNTHTPTNTYVHAQIVLEEGLAADPMHRELRRAFQDAVQVEAQARAAVSSSQRCGQKDAPALLTGHAVGGGQVEGAELQHRQQQEVVLCRSSDDPRAKEMLQVGL